MEDDGAVGYTAHLLDGCGHFPVEDPGFSPMLEVPPLTAEAVTAGRETA